MTEGVAFGFVRSDEVTAHAKAYKMSLILYKQFDLGKDDYADVYKG